FFWAPPAGVNGLDPTRALQEGPGKVRSAVWDLDTGVAVPLPDQKYPAMEVAFSADGRRVALAISDTSLLFNQALVCDAATGQRVAGPFEHPKTRDGMVVGVELSPDGRFLATNCYGGTSRLWDLATGKTVGGALPGWGGRFNRDGTRFAARGV